jgi:hypothetical protein
MKGPLLFRVLTSNNVFDIGGLRLRKSSDHTAGRLAVMRLMPVGQWSTGLAVELWPTRTQPFRLRVLSGLAVIHQQLNSELYGNPV